MIKTAKKLYLRINQALVRRGIFVPSSRHTYSDPQSSNLAEIADENLAQALDLNDPHVIQNPFAVYERLRHQSPVHYLEKNGVWLFLDYADVARALKQPELFSNSPRANIDPVLVGADPPSHTKVRQFLAPSFSNKELVKFGEHISICCDELLTVAIGRGMFDVVEDFAIPLTELAISHLLGLSGAHIGAMRAAASTGPRYGPESFGAIAKFFDQYLDSVEGDPEGNLCSRLKCGDAENSFTRTEIISLLTLLWVAATSTTRILISTCVDLMLRNAQLFQRLTEDVELMPQFIEEALRFDSPTQNLWKRTVSQTEVAGMLIPAGAEIRLCIGAANRDPKHYENADQFLLERSPKDQLAFGGGPHFCLGAALTRLETQIALKRLLTTCPDLSLCAPNRPAVYAPLHDLRALETLMVVP